MQPDWLEIEEEKAELRRNRAKEIANQPAEEPGLNSLNGPLKRIIRRLIPSKG